MTKFFKFAIATVFALTSWMTNGTDGLKPTISTAVACQTDTACDAARVSAGMPEYRGPKAPTTQTMVCLHALAYEPTELVLVNGAHEAFQAVVGDVINRWRHQHSQWKRWSRNTSLWVREICIPEAQLHANNNPRSGFRDLTLCNGTEVNQPGRNRSIFRVSKGHLQQLSRQRRISERDPACLLGTEQCAQYGL